MRSILIFLLLTFFQFSFSPFNVSFAESTTTTTTMAAANPYTPKASLIRYWNSHISNNLPKSSFFFSKASPLTALNFAKLTQLANQNAVSSSINDFCSLAHMFCTFDDSQPDLELDPHTKKDSNFALYANKNFASYGSSRLGGSDSFKNYSDGLNSANHSFKKYSQNSRSHREDFKNYAKDGNVATSNFINYASDTTGGSGEFQNYDKLVNVPNLRFTSYDPNANTHKLSFSNYNDEANSGAQIFTSYGKKGNSIPNDFTNYAGSSNIITSTFTSYGESGKNANDSFKSYGLSANNPHTNFKSYGFNAGINAGTESFSNYRNAANVGDDSFVSYARNSNSEKVNFVNYGRSFNHGNDTFKEYGKASALSRTTIGFTSYSMDRTFKEYYAKKGVTFAEYRNFTTASGNSVNRWVEPGKFFRESMLKQGNVMVMPDIRDKMPKRSFLPRSLLTKLPFSTPRLAETREIFHAWENSTMESVIVNALAECERSPSQGETKRCVGSGEDMIDFATSILGRNVVVRTAENVNGSKKRVMIGSVKGINGGKVTESVSCHQSLYPYLLYYCHSVPKVRVYEADIVDVGSKEKINHGVAICHVDTSSWGPEHGAFVALGSRPGQIEVCHWIFENDMTWTTAD